MEHSVYSKHINITQQTFPFTLSEGTAQTYFQWSLFVQYVIWPCCFLIQTLTIPWMTYWMNWIPQRHPNRAPCQRRRQGKKVTPPLRPLISVRKRMRRVISVKCWLSFVYFIHVSFMCRMWSFFRLLKKASPALAPKKRDELTFDDDEDDLMNALGFGETVTSKNKTVPLAPKKERYLCQCSKAPYQFKREAR